VLDPAKETVDRHAVDDEARGQERVDGPRFSSAARSSRSTRSTCAGSSVDTGERQ
jgi:hypothetical protein